MNITTYAHVYIHIYIYIYIYVLFIAAYILWFGILTPKPYTYRIRPALCFSLKISLWNAGMVSKRGTCALMITWYAQQRKCKWTTSMTVIVER